jgi:malonyl-CoA O-methyltransferase
MQPSVNFIQKAFNNSYKTYDDNAQVQYQVGLSLIKQIPKKSFAKVLDLGCGTGLITERLLAAITYAEVHVCDFASSLLEIAKTRLQHDDDVIFHERDFEEMLCGSFGGSFDLIFANMSLQWSSNFDTLLFNVFKNLNKGGILCFSIPLNGTFKNLSSESRNSFLKLASVKESLIKIGYQIILTRTENIDISFPSLVVALKSIKNTGASTIIKPRANFGVFNKAMLTQPFSLNYNIGFFIAQK